MFVFMLLIDTVLNDSSGTCPEKRDRRPEPVPGIPKTGGYDFSA
jgi:hypothetical protein